MSSPVEYHRPPTAQRAVLDELRRWIISGRLAPGDRVPQEAMAAEFNTSVIPVREALKTLESEGQLVHIPHRGFFVAELSTDELLELCDIRAALESMAVERALSHVTAEHLETMSSLISKMEDADEEGDVVRMVQLDRQFHFTLFEAAGKNQLTRIITTTWDQSDPYRAVFFNDGEHRHSNHDEHRRILETIKSGSAEDVTALLDSHRLRPVETIASRPRPD